MEATQIPTIAAHAHDLAQHLAYRCDRLIRRQRSSYSARRAEQIEKLHAEYRLVNGLAISHGAL